MDFRKTSGGLLLPDSELKLEDFLFKLDLMQQGPIYIIEVRNKSKSYHERHSLAPGVVDSIFGPKHKRRAKQYIRGRLDGINIKMREFRPDLGWE